MTVWEQMLEAKNSVIKKILLWQRCHFVTLAIYSQQSFYNYSNFVKVTRCRYNMYNFVCNAQKNHDHF